MRAAMRAVLDGKQVAVLAPTTILAFQHWKTFRKRFAPFPVTVEMVSRFRTAREIRKVVADTAAGKVDILIGTHRLLSRDVAFRDLGLLVIDEEQRFGVAAKERLKQLRREVDVLTLSATPIPRTLNLALAGIRDLSVIETPPEDRLPIQTRVAEASAGLVRDAIQRELDRGGQVFYVHNRVETIEAQAEQLRRLLPGARIIVGHGQMPEGVLDKVMLRFAEGEADDQRVHGAARREVRRDPHRRRRQAPEPRREPQEACGRQRHGAGETPQGERHERREQHQPQEKGDGRVAIRRRRRLIWLTDWDGRPSWPGSCPNCRLAWRWCGPPAPPRSAESRLSR